MSTKKSKDNRGRWQDTPLEELVIGGAPYLTHLTRKFRNRSIWMRPDHKKVLAVIPGTIQKILVEKGAEVEHGTPLMILEAMKMRNEVVSPVTGRIKRIHVSEGEQVAKSQLLIELK
ncbi:MAG: acetyl-CoA carboxylase biotin carboxyl carrier protein subunit [Bacteroidales bacterium]